MCRSKGADNSNSLGSAARQRTGITGSIPGLAPFESCEVNSGPSLLTSLLEPEAIGCAIGAIPVGFGLFDSTATLVCFNSSFAAMMALMGSAVSLGDGWDASLRDIIAAGALIDAIGSEREWLLAHGRIQGTGSFVCRMPDGRRVVVSEHATAQAGFVVICTDLSGAQGRLSPVSTIRVAPGPADRPAGPKPHLSPRARQVISLLVRGLPMKTVARELGITPRTIQFHKYSVMQANGLRNNADLLDFAIQHGLFDTGDSLPAQSPSEPGPAAPPRS